MPVFFVYSALKTVQRYIFVPVWQGRLLLYLLIFNIYYLYLPHWHVKRLVAGADITQFTRLDELMQTGAGRTTRQSAKPLESDTGHIFMLGKIACEQLGDALRS